MAVLAVAAAILAYGAWAESQSKDSGIGLRTSISDVPWDPELINGDAKSVYGSDDRVDVYQETTTNRRSWAASTCALVNASDLTDNGDGTYTLTARAFYIGGFPACVGEPFADQPVAAWCTGFKVNDDTLLSQRFYRNVP